MATESTTGSRVQRVRHELKRRELTVLRTETLSPHFISISFGGESLADFISASFDDHVKFILEGASGTAPVMRDYTPRRFDAAARELVIEFALHGDGPAAAWAAQARSGQRVTVGGPRGSFIIPSDYAWHLLAGDETALPAISRRLEELPAGARAIVLARVGDAADRRAFATAADVQLQWLEADQSLVDAARALQLPAGEGYAWCAGEAAEMAALRRVLVDEKGHDRHAIRAAAYWKRGASAHHENLEG
ncbi:siderophore-interacting protein [uncultured Ramlibacter sp.]|uniref:siderophore-interacting protein n=1 Tax=uncultured Ramlibacter sp. TaxID=260755 RepID=UPI00260E66AA|nr:siderophore-interacting protein [uncultured Ramlibacter sp.]